MTKVYKVFLLSVLFLLTVLTGTYAQDIIVKNNKEEIKAKVLEIEEYVIKYKKFEFQDGPTYSIKKSDVFMIIYKNGTRETFDNTPAPSNTYNQPQRTQQQSTYIPNNSQYNQQQNNQQNNKPQQNNQQQTASQPQNTIPQETTSTTSNDNTEPTDNNCKYAPERLLIGFAGGGENAPAVFSIEGSVEERLVANWVNFGLATPASFSDGFSSYGFGAYCSGYLPVNRMKGDLENQNIGFFPFFQPGISLLSTTVTYTDPITNKTVENSDWNFGFMLGLGVDWRFTEKFGVSVKTDLRALGSLPMFGINFNW